MHVWVLQSYLVTNLELQVAEAIKKLRTAVNETQQRFSDRIGVVVRTVARWELEKPPTQPAVLFRLAEVARNANCEDLARVFDRAILESFIASIIEQSEEYPASRPNSQLRALAWLMRAEPSAIGFYDRLESFLVREIASALQERGFASSQEAKQLGDLGEWAFEEYRWANMAADGTNGLGDAVRQVERELGFSDEQLALALGITVAQLQTMQQGEEEVTSGSLVRIFEIASARRLACAAYFERVCANRLASLESTSNHPEILKQIEKLKNNDDLRQRLIVFLEKSDLASALQAHSKRSGFSRNPPFPKQNPNSE